MTRKRYIKLTMAHGYQRNETTAAAKASSRLGISYRTLYTLQAGRRIYRNMERKFRPVVGCIQNVAAKAGVAFREFNRRMSSGAVSIDGYRASFVTFDEFQ